MGIYLPPPAVSIISQPQVGSWVALHVKYTDSSLLGNDVVVLRKNIAPSPSELQLGLPWSTAAQQHASVPLYFTSSWDPGEAPKDREGEQLASRMQIRGQTAVLPMLSVI